MSTCQLVQLVQLVLLTREVTLAWAPPGVPSMLATKYLRSLPQEHLSIQVSSFNLAQLVHVT